MNPLGAPVDPSVVLTERQRTLALAVYTVYQEPEDLPGVQFAVREWIILSNREPVKSTWLRTADSLAEIRRKVPKSADQRLPRNEQDGLVIVESWI